MAGKTRIYKPLSTDTYSPIQPRLKLSWDLHAIPSYRTTWISRSEIACSRRLKRPTSWGIYGRSPQRPPEEHFPSADKLFGWCGQCARSHFRTAQETLDCLSSRCDLQDSLPGCSRELRGPRILDTPAAIRTGNIGNVKYIEMLHRVPFEQYHR